MTLFIILVAIIGCLLLALYTTSRRQNQIVEQVHQETKHTKRARMIKAVEHNPFVEAKNIVYEQEQDPLLYVDDGTYYRQPIAIEGNRIWIEDHRPQINDLEWGQPLYSDRWACGLYNGSYKTYSS